MTREVDDSIVGETFDNLRVLALSSYRSKCKRITYWDCECTLCGKIKPINKSNLLSGNSSSCGCRKGGNKKIAELANVSPSTVSRIIRNNKIEDFKTETVDKVRRIAKSLNYTPWYRKYS